MSTEHTSAEILNNLIQINNDRIACYQKAIENLKDDDTDLKVLFIDMIEESHNCKMELAGELSVLKGKTENDTTTSGKLYRHGWTSKPNFLAATGKAFSKTANLEKTQHKKDMRPL